MRFITLALGVHAPKPDRVTGSVLPRELAQVLRTVCVPYLVDSLDPPFIGPGIRLWGPHPPRCAQGGIVVFLGCTGRILGQELLKPEVIVGVSDRGPHLATGEQKPFQDGRVCDEWFVVEIKQD